MKNVLLLVHDDIGQEARFRAAIDVTRALGGHLQCLDVVNLIPWPIDAAEGSGITVNFDRKMEAKNKSNLLDRLVEEKISWEWIESTGPIAPAILQASSKLIDLIVVNRRLDDYPIPNMDRIVGDLIVRSNLPVLAVPESTSGIEFGGAALIAWDGSSAASAVLAAAVPLLKLAAAVRLLEIDDGSVQTAATEAAAYLSRHGINAEIVIEDSEFSKAPSLLLAHSSSGQFAYIVMGGFGHNRFIEAVFGGVTRMMLDRSPIALLMAH